MIFNRKHLTTLVATLLLATLSHSASAYAFMVDGIAYSHNSDGTVSVTYTNYAVNPYVISHNYENLTDVNIPSSVTYKGTTYMVTSISDYAFYSSDVKNVTIPKSITSIGKDAFHTVLRNVYLTDMDAWCKIVFGAGQSNPLSKNDYYSPTAFLNGEELTDLIIPESVTKISSKAFINYKYLKSVTIPNSVTIIGENVFSGCDRLTKVTMGNSIDSIGRFAFNDCNALNSVHISDLAAWCRITFDGAVANPLSYAHHLFLNDRELMDLDIPNTVASIGSYAFNSCTSLTSVTLPNNLTNIGNSAFSGCTGLTNVILPKSVTTIGSYAFNGCSGLKYVNCKPTTPPTITGSNAFPSNIPIIIPSGTMAAYKNANYWRTFNLRYTLTKITPYKTHAIIVSEDKEISHLVKVKLNNKEYSVSNDSILIDGLQPRNYNEYENNHTAVAFCKVLGEDRVDTIQFRTMPLNFIEMSGSSTQSTITPKFKVDRADEHGIKISITSSGASYGYPSMDYSGRIIEETDDYYVIETVPITGLTPNRETNYKPWVTCNGKRCEGPQYNITTQNIGTSSNVTTGPTNVEMTGSYNAGDATVKDAYFTFNGQQMKKIVMTGLRPSTTYSTVYTVVTNNSKINTNMSFTTKSLTMTTQEARMLSDTSPMLIAETNMADVETSCGFEWRRYDAPEEMPSAKVYCPVYGGTMAGVLKNMSPNVYYKYRPFYKASDGSEYYGNWIAFITADAGVTFEPVVYTYKAPEVTQNTATLQGVALPGSSEITEQGFEYWRMNGSKAPTGTVNKVTATGQRMSATVQGLNAGATYGYRSYVKAGGQTYYGSEEQFTTEKPTGDVNGDSAVNVSDVTTLVNMILGVIPKDNTRADIDGNGTVNVSDVTALVNLILGIS